MNKIFSKPLIEKLNEALSEKFTRSNANGIAPVLAALAFVRNDATDSYLESKTRSAAALGVTLKVFDFQASPRKTKPSTPFPLSDVMVRSMES